MSDATVTLTGWRKTLDYPEGQSLVYWLAEHEKGSLKQIVFFAAFMIMFRLITGTWQMSFVTIASMYLHEWLGHATWFQRTGIKHQVLLLFPLGAVAMPSSKEENERSDTLPYNTLCWLMICGPAVNVGIMVIAKLIQFVVQPTDLLASVCRDVIMINGLLAYSNLLPFWNFDAGQIAKLIFNSLDEREDTIAAVCFTIITVVFVIALLIFTPLGTGILAVALTAFARFGWIGFVVFSMLFIWRKATKDDPTQSEAPQSLTNNQVVVHICVWLGLVVLTLVIFAWPIL